MLWTAYPISLLATALISFVAAVYAWRQRPSPGSTELSFLMLAVGEWALATAFEMASTSRSGKLAWSAVQYWGITTAPVLFFLYALRHMGLHEWLSPWRIPPLFLIPAISVGMAATNEWHRWLWAELTLTTTWAGVIGLYGRGPWFYVQLVYSYILVVSGIGILLWAVVRFPHLYSRQSRALVAAALLPLLGNAAYIFGQRAVAGIDPAPTAFAFTGLLLALAIRRYRLLDLVPLAREALFENVQDAVLFMDVRRRIVDFNPAAQRLLGLGADAIGQDVGTGVAVWPQIVSVLGLAGDEPRETSVEAGGTSLHIWTSALRDRRQRVVGRFAIVRDVTRAKRAEEERLQMERRLLRAQKLESLGVLAGGIAHDYNNLLTAIIGNLDLAEHDLESASPTRQSLAQARRAAERAAALTRQMLAYVGRGSLLLRVVDLSKLVEEMMSLLKASVPETVTLDFQLALGLPPIVADPSLLEQVVMNLVVNGAEAMDGRVGVVSVETGTRVCDSKYLAQSRLEEKPFPGPFVYLQVSDTGCGMEPAVVERIWEPFFSTKFAGRGLGLAAVSGIVGRHKGAILVRSKPGLGTVITVLFPVAETGGGNQE